MSFHSVSTPRCIVQIFPWEGGIHTLSSQGTPGRIVSCTVQRDIRHPSGNFQIVLAPGGPNGVDGPPTWVDVLTPMSTVQIAMQRGDRTGVVMVGVLTEITESTTFEDGRVIRTTTVAGKDIGYFFENFSFFTLSALGIFPAVGGDADTTGANGPGITELANFIGSIDPNLLAGLIGQGNPSDIAANWYTVVMLGVLQNTMLNNGTETVTFADAVSVFIEEYPNFDVPFSLNYIESEFTFDQKLKSILEWPQYEVFYATLPVPYPFDPGVVTDDFEGQVFTVPGIDASAQAWFVGRITPIPVLNADLSDIDTSKWDVIPANTPDGGFISCNLKFSSGEVANFYMMQSNAVRQLIGKANDDNLSPVSFSKFAVDIDSLARYGYRPHWQQTNWTYDMNGQYAKQHGDEFLDMVRDLLARQCSWFHPIPLMAEAEVTYPLMPDVFIGEKFEFNPKKYDADWTFYIRSVTHQYTFGGPSTTTLGLERGLPTAVYNNHELLFEVVKGIALRIDGDYSVSGNTGLQLFPIISDGFLGVLNTIKDGLITPQFDINS